MYRLRTAAIAASLLGLSMSGAHAETTTPAAGSTATSPEKTAPATNLDTKPGSLSDKLGSTNGVITPSGDVDPGMHKAPPQTGTMPVLKPGDVPAQPGGKGTGGLE